jgi:hypothetical protein
LHVQVGGRRCSVVTDLTPDTNTTSTKRGKAHGPKQCGGKIACSTSVGVCFADEEAKHMHTCHSRHDLRHPFLEPLDKRPGRIVKHRHRVHLRNGLIVVVVVRHGSCFPSVFTSSSSRSLILVSALVLWAQAQSKLGKRSCKRVLHEAEEHAQEHPVPPPYCQNF